MSEEEARRHGQTTYDLRAFSRREAWRRKAPGAPGDAQGRVLILRSSVALTGAFPATGKYRKSLKVRRAQENTQQQLFL